MKRRAFICSSIVTTTVGAPSIARAQHTRPLKFVPIVGLTLLDPTFAGIPHTRCHGYLVFDTLYGLDENFTAHPQMVEGHTVESGGTVWKLTLREDLKFHDST